MTLSRGYRTAFEIIRRRAVIIAIGGILATGLAFVAVALLPPRYVASAQVVMLANAGQATQPSDLAQAQALARNYASLVKTDSVLQDAAATAKEGATVARLRLSVDVQPSRDSFYLTITDTDERAQHAADVVNAVAAAFLRRVEALETQVADPAVQLLRDQVKAMTEQVKLIDDNVSTLQKLNTSTVGDPASQIAAATTRNQSIATLLNARASIQERLDKANTELQLALAKQKESAVLWAPATPPDEATATTSSWLPPLLGLLVIVVVALLFLLRDWSSVQTRPVRRVDRAASQRA